MKEKLQKLAKYLFWGGFGLGFIVLRAGLKSGNTLFISLGIAVMTCLLVIKGIQLVVGRSKQETLNDQRQRDLEIFKNKAQRVSVNLKEIEIKANHWTDVKVIDDSAFGGINELTGYHESNIIKVDRNLNSIRITFPLENKRIDYIANIEMDLTTLRMRFAIKKETTLYINGDDMYLDLDFLSKKGSPDTTNPITR